MQITNIQDLEKKKNVKTYCCGSKRLTHAIETNLQLFPINTYKHRMTGRVISVFVMSDRLSEFLKEWTQKRPKKKGVV